ncbi:MAG: hypothetical protein ACFFAY_04460 [Promethearchaeota archaeon]
MTRGAYTILAELTFVVLIMSVVFLPVDAAVVWSDDFDDLNYDGWTGDMANYTADNGYLECTENTSSNYYEISLTSHENTVEDGTWSFDVISPLDFDHGCIWVQFWVSWTSFVNMDLTIYADRIELWRGDTLMGQWDGSWPGGWNHIDVTADESWNIEVLLNGEHIIHRQTLDPASENELFRIGCANDGDGLDNIVASDTVDVVCTNETCEVCPASTTTTTTTSTTTTTTSTTTTSTTTTTTDISPLELDPLLLAAAGIGTVVIVLVAVVVLKKR